MNVHEAFDTYKRITTIYGYTEVTIYDYRREFERFYKYGVELYGDKWDICRATPLDIHGYLSECIRQGKQPSTVNRSRDALSSLFQALTVSGDVQQNPVANIRAIKCHSSSRPYLDRPYAILFIESIEDPLIQLATRFMYYTGIRISELTTLSARHVNLENQMLTIIGKGRKQRQIPLHDTELVPYLKEYKARELQGADEYALFFRTRRTGGLAPSTVNKTLRKVSQRLGSNVVVTSHMFRHSFATRYLYEGGQIHELQYLLGHNHIETTAKYLHVRMDAIRFTIQKGGAEVKHDKAQ